MPLSKMSMVQEFTISRDKSCRINVESRPLSSTTFGWPKGQDMGSSAGGDERFVSQESSSETNGDINFTSSNGLWLGCYFAFGLSGKGIGVAEAVVPNFSFRLPWEGFLWKIFSKG